MAHDVTSSLLRVFVAGCAVAAIVQVQAQTLSGRALADALKRGGYVLVMRHASSPSQPPDAATADRGNTARERQLDETGRTTSTAMGNAIKSLKIPVGEVYSSPTYRARETARLAKFSKVTPVPELGDRGKSMQAIAPTDATWLRQRVAQAPPHGTNVLVITHQPNIVAAFPQVGAVPGDGEMLVFQPDGKGGAAVIGVIRIEDWPMLARR